MGRTHEVTRMTRLWFALTAEERLFVAGILAIALVGVTARWLALRAERPDPLPAATAAPLEDTP